MADGFMGRYEEHMVGRNGADAISRVCLAAALILIVLSFFAVGVGPFLYVLVLLLGIASAVYAVFRMNSRNVARRRSENEAFLGLFKRGASRGDGDYEGEFDGYADEDGEVYDGGYREGPAAEEPRTQPRRRAQRPRQEPQAAPQPEPREEAPAMVTVSCESCGQRLNVPTGKGNIRVTCPRCSHQFTMMS